MKNNNKIIATVAAIALLAAWILIPVVIGPAKIVQYLGFNNSYLIAFSLAVLGGVSSLTATPFYATIVILVIGGVDIPTLSIVAGLGLSISDTIFYYLGRNGRRVLNQKAQGKLAKLSNWIGQRPPWSIPVFIFLYIAFAPLPNDIIIISLALTGYPFKKLAAPIVLGDITAIIFISYLTQAGVKLFNF